ncbi:MAG TPA: NAD(P)/FAD-dependent oxidoreductase [Chitinophagales bacterium]|nr:NAD(P)/FAD-dependent oxidoreductase [Chitinophagales bacterium]
MKTTIPVYDVLIVGAGISGIGAAYHLQRDCPKKSFAVLEGRDSVGGTWDLFRYPGIRSDSDMYTLGFSFNPWKNPKAIADGPAILQYIKDTAAQFGIDKKIKLNHKVKAASWSDAERCWTLTIQEHESVQQTKLKCKFLFMCSGYYDYDNGYTPDFTGIEDYKGKVIHPQKWDENIDYTHKKVIIIGSGATAVTLVPEMAKKAEKVYMLQRTPTYVVSLPGEDRIALSLRKKLPEETAYQVIRWKNILLSMGFYNAARQFPDAIKNFIQKRIQQQLGQDFDIRHFDPPYKPWDQRLCVVPNGDLFKAIKKGKAEVVTDHIDHFTEKGILLKSGQELEADIIVTATGLKIQLLGGMTAHINGRKIKSSDAHCYKGLMMSDAPNFAFIVGYTNSSWTLKADLSSQYVTRLLNYMDKKHYEVCTPRFKSDKMQSRPLLDFDAGYVKRAFDELPKQGDKMPWMVYQNYIVDALSLKFSPIHDSYLEYK